MPTNTIHRQQELHHTTGATTLAPPLSKDDVKISEKLFSF
jgi:hypothetical protein